MVDQFDMTTRLESTLSLLQRANLNFKRLNLLKNHEINTVSSKADANPSPKQRVKKVSHRQKTEPDRLNQLPVTEISDLDQKSEKLYKGGNEMLMNLQEMQAINIKMHEFQKNTIKQHHSVAKLAQKSITLLVENQFQSLRELQMKEVSKQQELSKKLTEGISQAAEVQGKLQSLTHNVVVDNLNSQIEINDSSQINIANQLVSSKLNNLHQIMSGMDEKLELLGTKVSNNNLPSNSEIKQHFKSMKALIKTQPIVDWSPISFNCSLVDPQTIVKMDPNTPTVRVVKQPDFILLRKNLIPSHKRRIPTKDKSYYISSDSQHDINQDEISNLSPVSKKIPAQKSGDDKVSSLSLVPRESLDSGIYEFETSPTKSLAPQNDQLFTNTELSAAYQQLLGQSSQSILGTSGYISNDFTTFSSKNHDILVENLGLDIANGIIEQECNDFLYEIIITTVNELRFEKFKKAKNQRNDLKSELNRSLDYKLNTSISEPKQKELIMGLLGSDTSAEFSKATQELIEPGSEVSRRESTNEVSMVFFTY